MNSRIADVRAYPLRIPRDTPYLGPLEDGVVPNEAGYFIRPGNQSIYNVNEHTVLIKVVCDDGTVGWGECYAIVAPQVVATLINDVIGSLVVGRDAHDVMHIYEDLYDAMRVRGFFGGYYVDAIAGLDIAIWDLRGRLTGLPLCKLLGAKRTDRIPAYVSGLPKQSRDERAQLAAEWIGRGYSAVKFAAVVAHDGEVAEMEAIREAVGPSAKILVDLHWRYTDQEAIRVIEEMDRHRLHLAEAPVKAEDLEGQARVTSAVSVPIAIGEELRTVFEFLPRFRHRCMSVIQPEMARMGVTAFMQVCQMARAFHCRVMPHASIGIGIFQAASLHASAATANLDMHEYQHSIFDKNLQYISGGMRCEEGFFHLPDGLGLGVEPREEVLDMEIHTSALPRSTRGG